MEQEQDHEWLLRRLRERQFAELPVALPPQPQPAAQQSPVSQSDVSIYAEGGPQPAEVKP